MKVQGKTTIGLKQKTVTFSRDGVDGEPITITFLLTGLPIGYFEGIEKELPSPNPPQKGFVRNKDGRFIKNENGQPIPFFDNHDPEYKKDSTEISKLQSVAMLYQSLTQDPNVEWDVSPDDTKDKKVFYRLVLQELKDFGLTMGELAELFKEVSHLSNLTGKEIDEARDLFLSEA